MIWCALHTTVFTVHIQEPVYESCAYLDERFVVLEESEEEGITDLEITMNETLDKETSLAMILKFANIIAKILRCEEYVLHLQCVALSPLRLYYEVPKDVADNIFPLTCEEWRRLAEFGASEIKGKNFYNNYVVKQKGK